MSKAIMRAIATHSTHMNPGAHKHWAVGGSLSLVLAECGHRQHRKLSLGLPLRGRVRCKECEALRDGSRPKQKIGDGPWIQYGWKAGIAPALEFRGHTYRGICVSMVAGLFSCVVIVIGFLRAGTSFTGATLRVTDTGADQAPELSWAR